MSNHFTSLDAFCKAARSVTAPGPVAIVLAEDAVEIASTLRHHQDTGFATIIAIITPDVSLPRDLESAIIRIDGEMAQPGAPIAAVNRLIAALPGRWMYYCFNAEYLFFPFCENRQVGEMLAFHAEERREAMLTYVVDLYAGDLHQHPDAVCLEDARLDKAGYFALARPGEDGPKERQLDFHGGLRWRFEEHIPEKSRKIDRVAIFKSRPGLVLRDDFTFNDDEMNTYSCPWHHNLTAAVCSFRTAKALKTNPGSTFDIQSFTWHNSAQFEWHSRQLLELGLIEPGQWF